MSQNVDQLYNLISLHQVIQEFLEDRPGVFPGYLSSARLIGALVTFFTTQRIDLREHHYLTGTRFPIEHVMAAQRASALLAAYMQIFPDPDQQRTHTFEELVDHLIPKPLYSLPLRPNPVPTRLPIDDNDILTAHPIAAQRETETGAEPNPIIIADSDHESFATAPDAPDDDDDARDPNLEPALNWANYHWSAQDFIELLASPDIARRAQEHIGEHPRGRGVLSRVHRSARDILSRQAWMEACGDWLNDLRQHVDTELAVVRAYQVDLESYGLGAQFCGIHGQEPFSPPPFATNAGLACTNALRLLQNNHDDDFYFTRRHPLSSATPTQQRSHASPRPTSPFGQPVSHIHHRQRAQRGGRSVRGVERTGGPERGARRNGGGESVVIRAGMTRVPPRAGRSPSYLGDLPAYRE